MKILKSPCRLGMPTALLLIQKHAIRFLKNLVRKNNSNIKVKVIYAVSFCGLLRKSDSINSP